MDLITDLRSSILIPMDLITDLRIPMDLITY